MIIGKIKEIDVWIGKTLFHPIVISLCRFLNCTQYRLSRDFIFLGFLLLLIKLLVFNQYIHWFLWFVLTFCFVRAAFVSQYIKVKPSIILRIILIAGVIINIRFGIERPSEFVNQIMIFILLIGEYALTIDTIPPKKKDLKIREAESF